MNSGHIEFDSAPSVSSRQILGPSANRYAVTFLPPFTGHVTLSNDPVTADGSGYVLSSGQAPLKLNYKDDGDVVLRPWFALYSTGASGVSWVQVMG